MTEPAYSFTIPSLSDDLPLDCRIYIPPRNKDSETKGAILAHPYAPLGGSQDDAVVLSMTETLLEIGYIVTTFNFRGAGTSAGSTSWTGRPEVEDFISVVGFLVYYLQNLSQLNQIDTLTPNTNHPGQNGPPTQLVLGGYSFGSLILARLPPVSTIIKRFEAAERGTSAAEIILRANVLAKRMHAQERRRDQSPTGSHSRNARMTVGGEETRPSERRPSRESKRSFDVVREVPSRIKTHIKRHSGSSHRAESGEEKPQTAVTVNPRGPVVDVRYLLISPVLVPLTSMLLPPGLPLSLALPSNTSNSPTQKNSGVLSLGHPTLVLFGSSDSFTSAKRLRHWTERLERESSGMLEWQQIEGAGHFWREENVMRALQAKTTSWLLG